MKYILPLIIYLICFSQCRTDIELQPTGNFDTLGHTWMTIEREHIRYYFQGTGVEGASIYTDLHEDAYEQLMPIFNPILPQKLRYYVWTDWEQSSQIQNHPIDIGGFTVPSECICHVQADISVGHEIVHNFCYWAQGTEPESYSKFLNEGIAVAFDLKGDDKLETAKKALEQTKYQLNSITDIWLEGNQKSTPNDVLYPVGGAFFEYLYSKSNTEQFFAIIKRQTQEDAEAIYGTERLNQLISEFDSMLGL